MRPRETHHPISPPVPTNSMRNAICAAALLAAALAACDSPSEGSRDRLSGTWTYSLHDVEQRYAGGPLSDCSMTGVRMELEMVSDSLAVGTAGAGTMACVTTVGGQAWTLPIASAPVRLTLREDSVFFMTGRVALYESYWNTGTLVSNGRMEGRMLIDLTLVDGVDGLQFGGWGRFTAVRE